MAVKKTEERSRSALSMKNFIGTTLIGGVVFLMPLVFIVALIGKAFQVLEVAVQPVSNLLPEVQVAGIAPAAILTAVVMLLLCFTAGLLARSRPAQKLYRRLDSVLTQMIPGYAWAKGMTGSLSDQEAEAVLSPVLVRFDDQSQIGFEVDRTEEGLVAVYLPAAPNAREGATSFVDADRVETIDASLGAVVKSYKSLGRGSIVALLNKPK